MSVNSAKQSPHWIDQLEQEILSWAKEKKLAKLHVDDMKTPSGRVHVGSLRGVVLHDLVAKVLAPSLPEKLKLVSTYVINDMDPMDGLPLYLDQEKYGQEMGKPLHQIPAPSLAKSGIDFSQSSEEEIEEFKQAKNMAEFYALDFIKAFRKLGCEQEILWSHELYESGQMDESIKLALDKVATLKEIYKQVADYELPEKWYPFQVICPKCGKIGTTLVTDWDGQKVSFECQAHKVDWAKGCGYQGQVSPFGGTGKLLWKVDWPAHWHALGINVEGAGKDHCSAGGSRDMADAQCRQVFQIPVPYNIPYEFLLLRGSKMSSSKGVGTSAREFVELLPASVARFLFVNKHYNQVIDFDPNTNAIPDLFDEYDQAARIFWQLETGDQRLGRAFVLAQIKKVPDQHFLPRFRDLAIWMQHPEINLFEKLTEVKGEALTDQEKQLVEQRKKYAQIWLDRYAPEEYQLTATKHVPAAANNLSRKQQQYLMQVKQLLVEKAWEPQPLQQALFDLAKETVGARQGFQAIYLAFIGKKHGPRAAWFLLELEPDFIEQRIEKVTQL